MPTTRFRNRDRRKQSSARVLSGTFAYAAAFLLTSCHHAVPNTVGEPAILGVASSIYSGTPGDALERQCAAWALTTAQVQAFFRVSKAYAERPYGQFYQIPCALTGTLWSEGREWTFHIGGGGTATWQHGTSIRHFGCSAPECATLVILPTDFMEPD